MSHRFVRCPHCKTPHDAAERVCPTTGLRLPDGPKSKPMVSRMSEEPPPSRPPEPFGPVHDRLDRRPPQAAEQQRARPAPRAPARELPRDLIGQTVGGRYLVRGVLGEGGMGTVFDAEHLDLGREVAIKVLSPAQAKKRVAVKRFQQEARAAGAIGHPNICEVYDLGRLDDGSPYLVMEKLVGQTLADRIAKEGGLPFDDVADIVGQVLSGLIAAHEKGIIHRDIKPENIFLARRLGCPPIIKLLDFGVSKMMAEFQTSEDSLDLTRTGMVMGTPYYMSPEQARGERNLDGRVDVYACGVVMYEALTGKRPFLAPNYNALLLAIINTSPKSIRELRPATPPELEAIISKAMQRSRDERYASARDMLRELVPPPRDAARVDMTPTPEERRRAPILGGKRGPGADRHDDATRVETGARPHAAKAAPTHAPESRPASYARMPTTGHDDGSIDIPIDVASMREDDIPVDEDPTHVFRPGQHGLRGAPAPRLRSAPPPPPAAQRPSASAPSPEGRPPSHPPPRLGSARPGTKAPLLPSVPIVEDWEGETLVKRPAAPRRSAPPPAPPAFNPEQTMKIEGSELDRLENRAPPRRR